MSTLTIKTKISLQKWLSLLAILACNAAMLMMGYTLGFSAFWLCLCLLGGMLLSVGILICLSAPVLEHRSLDLQNEIEAHINHEVVTYSHKLGIVPPRIIIQTCTHHEPLLEMSSLGSPFTPQLVITQDWLAVLNHGMAKASFAALIAHELSHLKNHDSLFTLGVNSVRLTLWFALCLSFANAALMLATAPLICLGLISFCCVVTLLVELLSASFSRALEKQADLMSAHLTQNPMAAKQFIYDLYLQFLYFGKLVTENRWAARHESAALDPALTEQLKAKHAQLSELNASQVFADLHVLTQTNNQDTSIFNFSELKNRSLTWLNTHPYVHERVDCIERAYTRPSR